MPKETTTIAFRTTPAVKATLERLAAASDQKIGEYLRLLVERHIEGTDPTERLADQVENLEDQIRDQRSDFAEAFRVLGVFLSELTPDRSADQVRAWRAQYEEWIGENLKQRL